MQRRKFLQRTAALGAVAAAGGAFPAGAAPDALNAVPAIALNDGNAMPLLGFGTSRMTDPKECQRIVEDAIAAGYRLFDTAKNYFNEEYIGNALKTALGGGMRREDFFITSKLWIDDASESKALAAFEKSLEKLGLEYLDLYLIHQPFGDVYGAWRAMARLKKEGRIKSIGVSNFYADRVMDFCLNNEIAPAVNQIEFSVLNQRRKERKVMDEFGMVCESWAPFVSGSDIFSNETLKAIAKNHGKSVAQVILRWHMQQRVVTIPKTSKKERMAENMRIFDFTLAPDEMEKIAALDTATPQFTDHTDPERIKWMHGLGKRKGKF